MTNPSELNYTRSHMWVRYDGADVYVGLTDYAQQSLGDMIAVNLPEEDDEIEAGEPMGDVEAALSVSDLFAPVSGTVAEVNEELFDAPEVINDDPYEAWIAKITDITDTDEFLTADEYEQYVEEEEA